MKYDIIIAEDDILISEELKIIIEENPSYNVVGIAENFDNFVKLFDKNTVHFCLLDIKMQGREQGFEIAEYIKQSYNIPIVFISSYVDQSTLQKAAKYLPSGYISKPFRKEQIHSAIQIALSSFEIKKSSEQVIFKNGSKKELIQLQELLWIKSSGVYSEVQTTNSRFLVRDSLANILNDNSIPSLIKVHRSYLVNSNNIKSVGIDYVEIEQEKIPISRQFRQNIQSLFDLKK